MVPSLLRGGGACAIKLRLSGQQHRVPGRRAARGDLAGREGKDLFGVSKQLTLDICYLHEKKEIQNFFEQKSFKFEV